VHWDRRKSVLIGYILGAIILLVAGLNAYTHRLVSQALLSTPPRGEFVSVDNNRLHYLRAGKGQSIVLIHGLGGMLQDFTMTIFDSLTFDHDVIAFDRPGYGYSDHPKGEQLSIELHARILHEAIVRLGLEKPILVGHSLGGGIALAYALAYPDEISGLVLLAPAAYPVSKTAHWLGGAGTTPFVGPLFFSTLATPVGKVVAPLTAKNAFSPDTVPEDYLLNRRLLGIRPSQLRSSAEDLASMNQSLSRQCLCYSTITVLVTMITGDSDRLLRYSEQAVRLNQDILHSKLIVIPNSGHQIQFSHPDVALREIRYLGRTLTH
jgi:pimeloyl-ACP methyl ester carboxylesterase